MFAGAQVASIMRVPLLSLVSSSSASGAPAPDVGGVVSSSWDSSSSALLFVAASIYSFASMIISSFKRLRKSTKVLASIGGSS